MFYAAASCAMFAGNWVFNDGRFGTRQLVAGTIAYAVSSFGVTLALVASLAVAAAMERSYAYSSWRVLAPARSGGGRKKVHGAEETLDDHAFAGLARWLDLAGASARDGSPAQEEGARDAGKPLPHLLRHIPFDKLCPCPAPGCAGQLPSHIELTEMLVTFSIASCFGLALWLTAQFSPIFTFAARSWSTPWFCALFAVSLLAMLGWNVVSTLAMGMYNFGNVRLELRVQHRATTVALGDLIAGYRGAVEAAAAGLPYADPGVDAPPSAAYYGLQSLLISRLDRRGKTITTFSLGALVVELVSAAINIVSFTDAFWARFLNLGMTSLEDRA
ncbi:hypothetical protein DFJ74DRAFT_665707 [Hyaloraphidium curvatum]|nr:hypothetical protein DFJ74DRAFT_665707 [Hyaloraphidium curvatum]